MGTLAQFCPLLQTPVHASGTRHSRRTLSRRGSGRRSRRVTFCAAFLVTLAVPTPTLARGPEDVSRSPHVPSGHGAAHRDTIDGEHTPESTGRTWRQDARRGARCPTTRPWFDHRLYPFRRVHHVYFGIAANVEGATYHALYSGA
jgi:hypothetical protein